MTERKRRITAVLLSLMITFTMMPGTVFAAGGTAADKGSSTAVRLNSSDPFEFRTLDSKRSLINKAKSYPARYDLRDYNCVTPVKFQNPFGSCWGFAAIGAAESSILGSGLARKDGYKATTLDLSEKHLSYFASRQLVVPDSPQNGEGTHHWEGVTASEIMDIGGTPVLATNAFAAGLGPVHEKKSEDYIYKGANGRKDMRYFDGMYRDFCYSAEDDWSIDDSERFFQSYILKASYMLPAPAEISDDGKYTYNPAGTAAIKEQLRNKRGVEIGFAADTSSPDQALGEDGIFLSTKTWAHYAWYPAQANHAVEIVGWDDNYPRDNFISDHRPPEDMFPDGRHEGATGGGNGAWLVKNSWGSGEEKFPNRGEGNWGLKKGQDKGPYYKAAKNVNTGYFWLSYYDQSISLPEALEFDKANTEEGYYLDQHDFMQVRFMSASTHKKETKMSNVFQAEVNQELEAVSCQTTYPGTEVTYEVYLLQDNYQNPEDGIPVAKISGRTYEYGGFHKENIPYRQQVLIQKGQYYSVIVTQKTADSSYAVNNPVGFGDRENNKHYDVGIINRGESFVKQDGRWYDYSEKEVQDMFFENPGISKPALDNFPIKGFCRDTGKDIAMRVKGTSNMAIFRGQKYAFRLNFTGSSDAYVPLLSRVTWAIADGDEKYARIEKSSDKSRINVVPLEPNTGDKLYSYLTVSVKGIGTAVIPFMTYRFGPSVIKFTEHDDQGRPLPHVYTGSAAEPEVEAYLDSPYDTKLVKDKEYTVGYKDNVKCGAAMVVVRGAGELDHDYVSEEGFAIIPQKASITSVTAGPGSLRVRVADQKASGITGYKLLYRKTGSEAWVTAGFGAGSSDLVLSGLESGREYQVKACAYVYIPREKSGWTLEESYNGEMSEVVSGTPDASGKDDPSGKGSDDPSDKDSDDPSGQGSGGSADPGSGSAPQRADDAVPGSNAAAKTDISAADISGIRSKTYTGKKIGQSVKVVCEGRTLSKGADYKLSYSKNKNVGTGYVKITGTGDYSGEVTRAFSILPKGSGIRGLSAANKAFTAKWKKQSLRMSRGRVSGYQLQYSTDSKFRKAVKTVTVKGHKKTSKRIGGLTANKKYYVRVRTYKTVRGRKYCSVWSRTKAVSIK